MQGLQIQLLLRLNRHKAHRDLVFGALGEQFAPHLLPQRTQLIEAKVFTDEGESAFKQAYTERPQLQKLLAYLREHKEVTHVVFENLSRLARQGPEQATLLAQFKKAGLEYISVDEPNAESDTAAGRMAVSMIGVINEFYSDSLSERLTYRMQAGAKAGRHLHRAMLGYLNGKMPNGVKNIIPDPERANLVRKAFELVAEGNLWLMRCALSLPLVCARVADNS